ncbi:type 1 glutamine amidotransferase [Streptomonospora sp. PA3]|uniref:type 1 glutamine amidotransferase domain-containing protein n=1 Tax=Streptomonospora sp. PA3 TaxID=2607326 RepID=UPI0012DE3D56|nr:type 1 glutamine amidotransferase domain-containing protein [Streptomonospora sp. PA3]MUL40776.1 type 1 glutamine amidotransferase [Streptomonospora sp. PA3]
MATDLNGAAVAFLAAPEGTEQVELTEPWTAVEKAGGRPQLVSTSSGRIQAFNHLDRGDHFTVDATVGEVSADDFAALVLPGGVANPDFMRMDRRAVEFTKGFFDKAKPVAAICHAPWMLVEADAVSGRRLTSFPSLRTDIANAGGEWVDEEVVVCSMGPNKLVTSRKPDDIPAFNETLLNVFSE